jgi:hypothetical protein
MGAFSPHPSDRQTSFGLLDQHGADGLDSWQPVAGAQDIRALPCC